MDKELKCNEKHIPKKERINFLVGLCGQNFVYALVGGSFFTYFLTDISLIPASIVAILLILGKVWDGVNDPLIGSLIDKHTFKTGEKLRPFLKITPIPVGIFTVLMFVVLPGADSLLWLRISYFVIMYLCWDICYTMQDVAIWSITAMGTPNSDERENVIKWARTVGSAVFGAAGALIPMALEIFVKITGQSWQLSVVVFAILFGFSGALVSSRAYKAKERIPLQNKQEKLSDGFKLLAQNRILLLVSLSNILGSIAFGNNLITYFFKYMISPDSLLKIPFIGALGMTTIYSGLTTLPTFLAMLFADKIKRIFGNNYTYTLIGVQLISAAFRVVAYFVGFEGNMFWISVAVLSIGTMPTGVISIAQTSLFNDSIDYMEWKTGMRTEGITFSMQTFFTKVSSGVNQGLSMLALGALGYVAYDVASKTPNGTFLGAQNATFNTWIWPLIILTPAVASILYTIPLFFVKYSNKKKALVESDLQARRNGLPESGESPFYKNQQKQKEVAN